MKRNIGESFEAYKARRLAANQAAKFARRNPKFLWVSTRNPVLNANGTTTTFKGQTYRKSIHPAI